jgi:hypothetical protein
MPILRFMPGTSLGNNGGLHLLSGVSPHYTAVTRESNGKGLSTSML